MTTPELEKVARAMWNYSKNQSMSQGEEPWTWETLSASNSTYAIDMRERYIGGTRAALLAIREPSAGMKTAMMEVFLEIAMRYVKSDNSNIFVDDPDEDAKIWRSAVDYILGDTAE